MELANTERPDYPIELLHIETYKILTLVLKNFIVKDKAEYREVKQNKNSWNWDNRYIQKRKSVTENYTS